MADHSELVSEMPVLEKLSTQDRLKLARKRRTQQLKKWSQREKEYNNKRRKSDIKAGVKKNEYKVHFVPSVMLLEAAARNDVEEVRRLLMLGVSADSTNEDGLTALHQCCIDDSEEMMKLLIDFGANVNAKDSEQWTPLHAAATCGHLHLVKYLISKGADLLAVNADGNMPYDICEDEVTLDYIESEMAKRGITQEMIDQTRATNEMQMLNELKKLSEAGGDLEFRDSQGATPLHIASANGYTTVVEFLLDNHVSTDECDNDQWQPIHAAACWGHLDVLELLFQNGADVNAKTKNGETPYDICEDPELKERIIQLKNELETKKATNSNRLKRSHSQNTRSHSVRRTSIREKSQIAKREAREEARIRHEKEPNDDEDDDSRAPSESPIAVDTTDSPAPSSELLPTHQNGYEPESAVDLNNIELRIDSNRKKSIDSDVSSQNNTNQNQTQTNANNKEAIVIRNTGYTDQDSRENREPSLSANSNANDSPSNRSTGPDSVKVEIHVTVNTTPTFNSGTLSDLKKQRAERHRNSQSLSSSSDSTSNNQRMVESKGNSVTTLPTLPTLTTNAYNNSSHSIGAKYDNYDKYNSALGYETPPSPSAIKKFRGHASDIVGGSQKKGCCLIM